MVVTRYISGALTSQERKIVKALLDNGERNQDIQALINTGRQATINSARITEVKKNDKQEKATNDEVEIFKLKKQSFDFTTGLNIVDDERLIRAREAMMLAVHIFNSATFRFKTEVFCVLANIAWTYLLHEYYLRNNVNIIDKNGFSLSLSHIIGRDDSPLTLGIKNNLRSLKELRDTVEHRLLRKSDEMWFSLFQACCLNFNNTMCNMFGEEVSLANELSFTLQFNRMNLEQHSLLHKYSIPNYIEALDAQIKKNLSNDELSDVEYQFRVIYTLTSASKANSHIEFLRSDSQDGKDIQNVLLRYKLGDHLYPHKPTAVVKLVNEGANATFTMYNHTKAWRLLGVRPIYGAIQPENTNRKYCVYHPAHKDYTYSNDWVTYLINKVNDNVKFRVDVSLGN